MSAFHPEEMRYHGSVASASPSSLCFTNFGFNLPVFPIPQLLSVLLCAPHAFFLYCHSKACGSHFENIVVYMLVVIHGFGLPGVPSAFASLPTWSSSGFQERRSSVRPLSKQVRSSLWLQVTCHSHRPIAVSTPGFQAMCWQGWVVSSTPALSHELPSVQSKRSSAAHSCRSRLTEESHLVSCSQTRPSPVIQ